MASALRAREKVASLHHRLRVCLVVNGVSTWGSGRQRTWLRPLGRLGAQVGFPPHHAKRARVGDPDLAADRAAKLLVAPGNFVFEFYGPRQAKSHAGQML